jgi:hypothetical protein
MEFVTVSLEPLARIFDLRLQYAELTSAQRVKKSNSVREFLQLHSSFNDPYFGIDPDLCQMYEYEIEMIEMFQAFTFKT